VPRLTILLLVVLLAGCGGGSSTTPKPPQLPRALAHEWRGQADRIAAELASGDGCTAQHDATALRAQVIAAVNARRIPPRLLEPLTSAVNSLPERITCTPAPPPKHAKKPRKPKKPHGHGHGKGKGG